MSGVVDMSKEEDDSSSSTSIVDLNLIAATMRSNTRDDDSRTTLGDDDEGSLNLLADSQFQDTNAECVGYAAAPPKSLLTTTTTAATDKSKKKKGTKNKNKENVVPLCSTQPKTGRTCVLLLAKISLSLSAVDDCGCTSELAANNSDNPKGNKWTRLYDHLYGGVEGVDDSNVHGLLGNRWRVIPNPTKLKAKIQDIWTYVKKEKDSDGRCQHCYTSDG
jgi:hypothetical protein